jgi:hypothetical protein
VFVVFQQLSHFIGLVGLSLLGCLSCITAPPATLGVDAIAYEGCPDEPLFHNVPVPAEALFWCGIARQPTPEVVAAATAATSSLSLVAAADNNNNNSTMTSTRRLTSLSASHLQMAPREESLDQILKARNAAKRLKSQFFRSR